MEFGTSADTLDAYDAAVEHAAEQAVRAAGARGVAAHGVHDGPALVAERFGFEVSELASDRPPCPVIRHDHDCSCCYVGEQGRWHIDPACQI